MDSTAVLGVEGRCHGSRTNITIMDKDRPLDVIPDLVKTYDPPLVLSRLIRKLARSRLVARLFSPTRGRRDAR